MDKVFSTIEEAIADIQQGKMIVIVDDEDSVRFDPVVAAQRCDRLA